MYESFFGFTEAPFSLNPDPGFLYLGQNHSKALSILEFGLASESGITVITGAIGSGKTTLVRHLLNNMSENRTVGLITNTHKSFGQLIDWISMAFDLDHEGRDKVALYNQFVKYMIDEYAKGNRVVLIVDEAQNLDADTIEELRVISNINADKDLVLQLVLVGQPELKATLTSPDLVQFVQRISAYYHLKPLKLDEARKYIKHRVKVAGVPRNPFRDEAIDLIYASSAGVPRLINTLCHLALTYCFAEGRKTVTEGIMREILADREEHGLFGIGAEQTGELDLDTSGAIEGLREHHMGKFASEKG
jgi:type II secretory pathway predicted ATPase ExeA